MFAVYRLIHTFLREGTYVRVDFEKYIRPMHVLFTGWSQVHVFYVAIAK
jgi:hypothetical protein